MVFRSLALLLLLLLVLIACGAAPPATATPVAVHAAGAVSAQSVCEFQGGWSGTLRFADEEVYVSSSSAEARLFPSTIEALVHGGGWHLRGNTNLSEDHLLRVQQATWLGEGVGVARGLHVAVGEAGAGGLLVQPHPSAIEDITFTEAPGRWLGCDAVGLLEQSQDLSALLLPETSEASEIGLPFTLSHVPGGVAFAELRRNDFEEAHPASTLPATTLPANIIERRGDSARIQVTRYGGGSNVVLVGWVDAGRLGVGGRGGLANIFGSMASNIDHEQCAAPTSLPLYIEGASRIEAGEIDAGTQIKVMERDAEWAEVLPLGDELRLTTERSFFVPSGGLQCTTHRGTHLRETIRPSSCHGARLRRRVRMRASPNAPPRRPEHLPREAAVRRPGGLRRPLFQRLLPVQRPRRPSERRGHGPLHLDGTRRPALRCRR